VCHIVHKKNYKYLNFKENCDNFSGKVELGNIKIHRKVDIINIYIFRKNGDIY